MNTRPISQLARDESGISMVEFGFAAIPLFLAVMGTIELSFLVFVGAILESAVGEASRFGTTGTQPEDQSREERVMEIVTQRTLGLVTPENATIEIVIYENFADVGQPEPFTDENGNNAYDVGEDYTDVNGNGQWDADMGVAGLGGPGDIVIYTVTYTRQALTPLFEPIIGDLTQSASIAVRNEPF